MTEPAVRSVLDAGHVTRIEHQGREILLVGTAHVSARSVAEVAAVIEQTRPDSVCVELDQTRFDTLVDTRRWHDLDVAKVIREGRVTYLLTALALSAFQRRIGERLGVRPGAEMLAAIEAARRVGARVVLADREIQATLRRTWHSLARRDRAQLALVLVISPFAKHEEIGEERVEQLKDGAAMSDMLEELARAMPGLKRPLIDERDLYLISMVREAPGKRIVAVVGAGHVKDMTANVDTPVDRAALSVLPPVSLFRRGFRWGLSALAVALSVWAVTRHSTAILPQIAMAWALTHSLAAGAFALAAGAKIPSAFVAMIVAPLAALVPARNAGTFAGLVEARLRRQIPEDRENAVRDMMTLGGMYNNSFTRVLLVAAATTFGGLLGTLAGVVWLGILVR
jgi:pheromone shutdown-related protein TraB